jgi:hypothetical protein
MYEETDKIKLKKWGWTAESDMMGWKVQQEKTGMKWQSRR